MASETFEITNKAYLKIEKYELVLEKVVIKTPGIMRFQSLPVEHEKSSKKEPRDSEHHKTSTKKKKDTKNVWEYFRPIIGNNDTANKNKSNLKSSRSLDVETEENNSHNNLNTDRTTTQRNTTNSKRRNQPHSQKEEEDSFEKEEARVWNQKKTKLEILNEEEKDENIDEFISIINSTPTKGSNGAFLSSNSNRKKRVIVKKKNKQENDSFEEEKIENSDFHTPNQISSSARSYNTRSSDKMKQTEMRIERTKMRKLKEFCDEATKSNSKLQIQESTKTTCPICLSNSYLVFSNF
jgi:hypothetical protein